MVDNEKIEMLSSINQAVDHTDWRSYDFELKPMLGNYTHLVIEAYYKTPTLAYYNGNILVDNMSEMIECSIPETIIASADSTDEIEKLNKPLFKIIKQTPKAQFK